MYDQLRSKLESSIRDEVILKIRNEIEGKNKEQMKKKIQEMKRKHKPKLDQRMEEVKKKCVAEHEMKLKELVEQQELAIKSRVRQEYLQEKAVIEARIKAEYERKYEEEKEKILREIEELQRLHENQTQNMRRFQNERKNYVQEYETKDFDLTKQEIELKSQMDSVSEMVRQQFVFAGTTSMMKKSTMKRSEDLYGKSMLVSGGGKRRFEQENQQLNKSELLSTNNQKDIASANTTMRIILRSEELIDKAINDIGLEDIVARVVNRSEILSGSDQKKKQHPDFLIHDRNEIEDIM